MPSALRPPHSALARLPDWPARLAAYLEARRAVPFTWGSHDCAQFARGGIAAITGRDPAEDWGLGHYHTRLGATRVLRRLGGLAALPERAGCVEIAPAFARRGDVVLAPPADRRDPGALGLCAGTHLACAGLAGLYWLEAASAARAWRVG